MSRDAENPLTADLIAWADLIFVMERRQKATLSALFRTQLRGKRVVCLDIPDDFEFMDPKLVQLLESKVTHLLPRTSGAISMQRRIVGFHQDDEAHWVADLECGHTQHVRHDPPWQERPWVVSEEGRARFLGTTLRCKRCEEDEP